LFHETLFFAPIVKNPRKILDIGTGTGLWAVEMARKFPNARVKGTDLSVIQPSNAPGNVDWEISDCTDEVWDRNTSSMDFIHVSMLFGALSRYDEMIKRAKEYLVKGTGWIECQELLPTVFSDDNSIPEGWAFGQWLERYCQASSQCLRPQKQVMVADKLKQWMEEAGYVDVHEFFKPIPIGDWPSDGRRTRKAGVLWRENLEKALQGWSYKTLGQNGWGMEREEIEVLLAGARADLRNPNIHAYQKVYCVYGRRPTDAEADTLREKGHQGAQMTNR
jgi:hypothetical protein